MPCFAGGRRDDDPFDSARLRFPISTASGSRAVACGEQEESGTSTTLRVLMNRTLRLQGENSQALDPAAVCLR
jgi:hypothetical protein